MLYTIQDRTDRLHHLRDEIAASFHVSKGVATVDRTKLEKEGAKLESSPVAIITLAYAPSQEVITLISSLLRSHYGSETILLDIREEPGIVAGIVIEYMGKRLDRSLAAIFSTDAWKKIVDKHIQI